MNVSIYSVIYFEAIFTSQLLFFTVKPSRLGISKNEHITRSCCSKFISSVDINLWL